jgi:hypothetical protein
MSEIQIGKIFSPKDEPMFAVVEVDKKWVTVLYLSGVRKIEIGYFKERYLKNA